MEIADIVNKPLELLGWGNAGQVNKGVDTLESSKNAWQQNQRNNQQILDEYMANMKDIYGAGSEQYTQAMNNYANMGSYQPTTFSYDKQLQDFINPAMNMRVNTSMDALRESNGDIFSSKYMDAMNAKAQAIASEEADKAYNRMAQDKGLALQEAQFNAGENQFGYNANANRLKDLAQMYANDRQNMTNAMGDIVGAQISNNNAATQGMTNLDQSIANTQMAKKSASQDLLGAAAGFLGNIF